MSYGPPTKTAYGDQDFIKEDHVPQTATFGSVQPPPIPTAQAAQSNYQSQQTRGSPYVPPTPYGQLPTGQSGYSQISPERQPLASEAQQLLATSQSMTQEDLIFMNSWRRDTFYYKFLPFATIANGAYYYYNHSKDMPHKVWKYGLITGFSYLIAVAVSRGDLRRRVQESNSNTPFMQAMRRLSNLGGALPSSEFQENHPAQQDLSATWSTTGDGFSRRPYPPPQSPSTYSSPPATYDQPMYGSQFNQPGSYDLQPGNRFDDSNRANNNFQGGDVPKPAASYDELRAINRGLIPPR